MTMRVYTAGLLIILQQFRSLLFRVRMRLTDLHVFQQVALTGSFSEAARRTELDRSSVSRQIRRLEEELGVALIHRTTRSVRLTEAGVRLQREIKRPLGALVDIRRSFSEPGQDPTGTLRVSAPVDFGMLVLPDVVSRFLAAYPQVQLDLHLSNQAVDLVSEGFDLVFRAGERLLDSSLVAKRILEFPVRAYATEVYLERLGWSRGDDLEAHRDVAWLALREQPTSLHVSKGARRLRTPLDIVPTLRCSSYALLLEAAERHLGVALVLEWFAGRNGTESLIEVFPGYSFGAESVWALWPKQKFVPKSVRLFTEHVEKALAS